MYLKYQNVAFIDSMNFGPGCGLNQFGKMWGSRTIKSIFPYDLYRTIDDIYNDTEWPCAPNFASILRPQKHLYDAQTMRSIFLKVSQSISVSEEIFARKLGLDQNCPLEHMHEHAFDIDLHTFTDTWIFFEEEKREGRMENMYDFLVHYNKLDTELLVEAMQSYIKSFLENFQVNANSFVTLPAMAECILWKSYDTSRYRPFSFNKDFADLAKLIRSQIAGGLSAVFTRHIQLAGSSSGYDPSVHFAANGDVFRSIISYDVNSKCL